MKKLSLLVIAALSLAACGTKLDYDASGNFEADEVIVSAQQSGLLLSYAVREGMDLALGAKVGQIDMKSLELQKEQAQANIAALSEKTNSPEEQVELVRRQLAVQGAQLAQQQRERQRTANLVRADAATAKQLDDADASIDQLKRQIAVTRQQLRLSVSQNRTQNRSILSERVPLEKAVAQYQELIDKGQVISPMKGTVLVNYAMPGEMQTVGKPLFKMANLDTLNLRAYISSLQLSNIRLGQTVTVRIDQSEDSHRTYKGKITWIADRAEFSPKNIQTKDERANLIYAIKVRVKNDGLLKIGMYGEVLFNP
ncbi:HlyD family secretion protein [Nubsella zeaxanthinifaciens]|uniref:HlyD family secretion protein n=1 Tax=Nubsella zeaxanthinifaciens TaxID=392412 RepID=UPI003D00CDF1